KEVHRLICRGYSDVVDADLSRYFDSIPHDALLKSAARRIVDRHVLRLIKLWLKAPIEEWDEGDGTRRIGGGKGNRRGTPQGGVASPLLANIYMNRFLKYWRLTGRGEAFRAHVIAYADDFVILSRGGAAEALAWTTAVMTKLGLTLNEAKTSLRNAPQERRNSKGRARWCSAGCRAQKGQRCCSTANAQVPRAGSSRGYDTVTGHAPSDARAPAGGDSVGRIRPRGMGISRVVWPNGAMATLFSADEPDRLRGPQHDGAWCDEVGSWRYPEAWDMLMFGLLLGVNPRVVITTTPRPTKLIRELATDPGIVKTYG